MASIFTRIIDGELPGRFVWKDDRVVAFLTIEPLRPGHVLVVPRQEIDHWIDLPPPLRNHLFSVAQEISHAIYDAFKPVKVGMAIVGLEVPHVHIHLAPINTIPDMAFSNADKNPDPKSLDEAAEKIRGALRARGATAVAGR